MAVAFTKPIVCPIVIGRTPELTNLHALLDQTRSGQGQVGLLSGEAGIGKSRLVTEARTYAAAQGFLMLQGNCFPTDRSYPYAPLLDLLRSVAASHLATASTSELAPFARELHQLMPDLVPLPPDQAPPVSSDPEQEKRRLFTALAHFNGTITNDKFCMSRAGRLRLSWWRLPLRAREAVIQAVEYPSEGTNTERCPQEDTHEETAVDRSASHD